MQPMKAPFIYKTGDPPWEHLVILDKGELVLGTYHPDSAEYKWLQTPCTMSCYFEELLLMDFSASLCHYHDSHCMSHADKMHLLRWLPSLIDIF